MAAPKQRFSIRNYAATMRVAAVNPALREPFARSGPDNPPLPPISIRRYRWWADELADLITAADISTSPKSPSKRSPEEDFRSPELRPRNSKKIKTMVELFASSSQIEDVKKQVETLTEEEKKAARTRKRKRRRRKAGFKLNEKNICRSKKMSSTHIPLLQEPAHKKHFRKHAEGGVVESKEFEVVRTSPKRAEFIKCQRRRTRHVSFSGKDDILGGSNRCSRMDDPQFESPCENFSKVLVAPSDSSAVNTSSTNHEIDINAMAVDITDASSSQKVPLSDSHNNIRHRALETIKNCNSPSQKEVPLAVLIDLNQTVETNSNDEDFWGTAHREVSINSTEIHQEAGLPNTSTITPSVRGFDLNLLYHMPENSSEHHSSPKDLSSCMNMSISNAFISTPLNSQVVVQNKSLGSSPTLSADKDVEFDIEVNHLEIMAKKVFDVGSYQRNPQLEWCLNQYHPDKIHHGLNSSEITDCRSLGIRKGGLIEVEDGFLRSNSNERERSLRDYAIPDSFKKTYARENCNLNCQLEPVGQPMMRLMGQNVVVDGDNRYCHACGRSRNDMDCTVGESLISIIPEKNLPKHWIQPELSDSTSDFYKWKPRFGHGSLSLSRNKDESVGKYNSEVSFDTWHHYPTIESYEKSIRLHMMSSFTNSNHKPVTCEPQIRYHDRESPRSSLIQTSATLPRWPIHAKCSEGNHLSSSPYCDPEAPCHVHNLPPAQNSAVGPSSSQSSSIFTETTTLKS